MRRSDAQRRNRFRYAAARWNEYVPRQVHQLASRFDFSATFPETVRDCLEEAECLLVYRPVVLCNAFAQI